MYIGNTKLLIMERQINAIVNNTVKIGNNVDKTLNNTALIGQNVEQLQAQITSLKSEISRLTANQQVMNENLLRILERLH
ncbi:uncharacterized small protein (DUF1192 family) [Chryseobacterium sp. SORGH_AS 447]|nr:uncharacterized small protein (DUF1192 family) [Chryseobacterium sp. SORGH_AS_0447]